MKLLLDSCMWSGTRDELSVAGHDVVWVGDWSADPGDTKILEYAYADDRTLVTLDNDFGGLAVVGKMPHRGIIRLVGISARQQGQICLQVLALHATELEAGAIVTAESNRIRIRLVNK